MKSRRARWPQIVGVLGFLDVSACHGIASIDDVVHDECAFCTKTRCAQAAQDCGASAQCGPLAACLTTCQGEPSCRAQCVMSNSVAPLSPDMSLAGSLNTCLAASCANECGLACGGMSQIAGPAGAAGCEACIQANYCPSAEKCALSAPCQTYLVCRQNCATGDCIGACLEIDNSFFQFFNGIPGCSSACDIGNNWACVEHFGWPPTAASSRSLTVRFADVISGAPLVGVQVSMCEPTPLDDAGASQGNGCIVPVAAEQTDVNGSVTLTDATLNGQSFGLDGYLALSAPSLYPTLVYWGFPLSQVHGSIADPIPVFSVSDWSVLGTLLSSNVATLDPARGAVIGAVLDCFGTLAPGTAVALSGPDTSGAMPVYFRSDFTLVGGPGALTDTTGVAIFVNVPPGIVDVIATPVSIGRPSSRVSVLVKAGTVTEVNLSPTPQPDDAVDARAE
jgi:hypothetical protein